MSDYRAILRVFDEDTLPTLDVAVMGALQLATEEELPQLDFSYLERPLVLGSGNAYFAARILFEDMRTSFADESTYLEALEGTSSYDGVVVMSASGKKHAVSMVEAAKAKKVPVYLITNNGVSPAGDLLDQDHVHFFPKNREPYTYNTSTYLAPIFSHTEENANEIARYLLGEVEPRLLRNFEEFDAFSLVIPTEYTFARTMLRTKFDELFGPMVVGRVFTEEEIKHAKTVIDSGRELFISFGVENEHYGLKKNRVHIPLPDELEYGGFIAIAYFVIGKIQAAHPPYFARAIERYTQTASRIFGQTIKPIVE